MFLLAITYMKRCRKARSLVCIPAYDTGPFTLNLGANVRETGLGREDTNTFLGTMLSGCGSQPLAGVV